MEQHTANPSPTSNADSSEPAQPANQSAASSAAKPDERAPADRSAIAGVDVIERMDTGALADMAMLRANGCRCPLIAKGGRGVPFSGCDVTGDRVQCACRPRDAVDDEGA